MPKAAQLKRKAAEFEQKRQYDRALATYLQAIEETPTPVAEPDIPLYNRIGDLYLRQGDLENAVTYYETAADLYAAAGFFNNAIALCNKVLRHAPNRSTVYHKLGRISALKGFNSDAKQNFLEYAARMERAGDTDEAFRALQEFADLCPGQDDVRLMLADQLAKAGRPEAALEQLQLVYESLVAEERGAEAQATLERIRALSPEFEPRKPGAPRPVRRDGLVFLDVDEDHAATPPAGEPTPPGAAAPDAGGVAAVEGFEATSAEVHPGDWASAPIADAVPEPPRAEPALPDSPLSGVRPMDDPVGALTGRADRPDEPAILGLEPTTLAGDVAPPPTAPEGGLTGAGLAFDDFPLAAIPPAPAAPILTGDPAPQTPLAPRPDDTFVDLNDWLRESEPVRNPRMTADEEAAEPGAVQTDFAQMLATFKRGVAEHVDESDADSHYDLGVAYMEMGLADEAIAQFQKALRADASAEGRVRAYEALGRCFVERGDDESAVHSLRGALLEPGLSDVALVGVLYLLGHASERLGRRDEAAAYFRRVFSVDIHFRDVADRLRQVEAGA